MDFLQASGFSRCRVLAAGTAGNVVEWYDFALYGYLAPITAGLFFPSSDPLASLLNTYAVFALGFLTRPLGGLIFGHIGDRFGRRQLITLSVVMMAVPTFLTGMLLRASASLPLYCSPACALSKAFRRAESSPARSFCWWSMRRQINAACMAASPISGQ